MLYMLKRVHERTQMLQHAGVLTAACAAGMPGAQQKRHVTVKRAAGAAGVKSRFAPGSRSDGSHSKASSASRKRGRDDDVEWVPVLESAGKAVTVKRQRLEAQGGSFGSTAVTCSLPKSMGLSGGSQEAGVVGSCNSSSGGSNTMCLKAYLVHEVQLADFRAGSGTGGGGMSAFPAALPQWPSLPPAMRPEGRTAIEASRARLDTLLGPRL